MIVHQLDPRRYVAVCVLDAVDGGRVEREAAIREHDTSMTASRHREHVTCPDCLALAVVR